MKTPNVFYLFTPNNEKNAGNSGKCLKTLDFYIAQKTFY